MAAALLFGGRVQVLLRHVQALQAPMLNGSISAIQDDPNDTAAPAELRGTSTKAIITYQRRPRDKASAPASRGRSTHQAVPPRRASSRLAGKAPSNFIDMTTQAVQRKALLNSLSGCSKELKKHIKKRDILSRNNLPLSATELRKLVSAAQLDLGDGGAAAVDSSANA
jgi:hypothetical protein